MKMPCGFAFKAYSESEDRGFDSRRAVSFKVIGLSIAKMYAGSL
jgi:hypothetical protein